MTERRRRQTSELKLELEIARVREDAGGAQEKVERKRRGGEAEAGEEGRLTHDIFKWCDK